MLSNIGYGIFMISNLYVHLLFKILVGSESLVVTEHILSSRYLFEDLGKNKQRTKQTSKQIIINSRMIHGPRLDPHVLIVRLILW